MISLFHAANPYCTILYATTMLIAWSFTLWGIAKRIFPSLQRNIHELLYQGEKEICRVKIPIYRSIFASLLTLGLPFYSHMFNEWSLHHIPFANQQLALIMMSLGLCIYICSTVIDEMTVYLVFTNRQILYFRGLFRDVCVIVDEILSCEATYYRTYRGYCMNRIRIIAPGHPKICVSPVVNLSDIVQRTGDLLQWQETNTLYKDTSWAGGIFHFAELANNYQIRESKKQYERDVKSGKIYIPTPEEYRRKYGKGKYTKRTRIRRKKQGKVVQGGTGGA